MCLDDANGVKLLNSRWEIGVNHEARNSTLASIWSVVAEQRVGKLNSQGFAKMAGAFATAGLWDEQLFFVEGGQRTGARQLSAGIRDG